MPATFDACQAGGGRVRTISGSSKQFGLKAGEFVRVCFPKGGGDMVRGEKRRRKADRKMVARMLRGGS